MNEDINERMRVEKCSRCEAGNIVDCFAVN